MKKLSIRDMDLKGKRVLTRVDFNVPLDEQQNITDDTRIKATIPTIKHICENGGKAILMSHLGRPKGKVIPEMSLSPVANRLKELLKKEVIFASDCVGGEAKDKSDGLEVCGVLLLENLRFHSEETKNDPDFAKKLSELGDVYVNDAFGTAHRAHASVEAVTKYFDRSGCGFLMEKELEYFSKALENPARPYVVILGGAKISDKIGVMRNLLDKVDRLLIGGGMAFTFFKSQAMEVGDSIVEEDKIPIAKEIRREACKGEIQFLLPVDLTVADRFDNEANRKVVDKSDINPGWRALDIGPTTIKIFCEAIKGAKTVVWNGPMGVFEFPNFAEGTVKIATSLADETEKGAVTIIGGGDTVAAVRKAGVADKLSHISTGGGASLELLEGKTLPGVAALSDT